MSLKLKKGVNKQSAYNLRDPNLDYEAAHTLSIIVDNESGVLARVIGLFSGRGYNIDSLTVAEVDPDGHRSRITIVTTGTPKVINQIIGFGKSFKSMTLDTVKGFLTDSKKSKFSL